MGQLLVRNLDDAVIERLKRRASDNKRSLESEVRHLLAAGAGPSHAELVAEVRARRARTKMPVGGEPAGWEIIRHDRDDPFR